MNFEWNAEQQALIAKVREFQKQHCNETQAQALDRNPIFPADLHRALADAGLLGYSFAQAAGGQGGNVTDLAIIQEALGGHSDAALNLLFVNNICGMIIMFGGSDAQKQNYLPAIVRAEKSFAFALTEPEAGSDAGAIATTAHRDGDEYVVNGVKLYTTGANDADFILTAVRSNDEAKASRGTSLLLVARDAPGLDVQPMDKLAGNAVASCRVEYNQVRVPVANRVGGEHQAWPLLMLGGGLERLIVSAAAVGTAQTILDDVLEFVQKREQFGQPVGNFQAVQHQLADMACELDAARLLVYRAAWLMDQGKQPVKEVSMAKLFASERLMQIALRGMRLLGGQAYFMESAMQRRMRESMLSLYAGGTMEIQRNLIARSLGL